MMWEGDLSMGAAAPEAEELLPAARGLVLGAAQSGAVYVSVLTCARLLRFPGSSAGIPCCHCIPCCHKCDRDPFTTLSCFSCRPMWSVWCMMSPRRSPLTR